MFADGLELVFPFGRHVFLPKPTTTVRIETVGAVAMIERRHLGYLLHDGVLFEPGQRRAPATRVRLLRVPRRLTA